jgi:hypothetical protein
MSMKSCNDIIGNRTRDLPSCSAVPQPTAPPFAPCCFGSIGHVDLMLSVLVSLTADSVTSVLCSVHKNRSHSLMLSRWITCALYLEVNRQGRNTGSSPPSKLGMRGTMPPSFHKTSRCGKGQLGYCCHFFLRWISNYHPTRQIWGLNTLESRMYKIITLTCPQST